MLISHVFVLREEVADGGQRDLLERKFELRWPALTNNLLRVMCPPRGVLTSQPEFMHSVDCQSDLDYMLLSGSRKLSQQRRELSSILITVGFIWMQRRKLHLAMRSSDDHNAINRGEWAAVCLCLLWELQQLVWSASGDIWAQYTWWISFICHDLDVIFFFFLPTRQDSHLDKQIML